MIKAEDLIRFKKEKIRKNYQNRERINEILLIHPSQRSKEEEVELVGFLIDYPCFQCIGEDDFD